MRFHILSTIILPLFLLGCAVSSDHIKPPSVQPVATAIANSKNVAVVLQQQAVKADKEGVKPKSPESKELVKNTNMLVKLLDTASNEVTKLKTAIGKVTDDANNRIDAFAKENETLRKAIDRRNGFIIFAYFLSVALFLVGELVASFIQLGTNYTGLWGALFTIVLKVIPFKTLCGIGAVITGGIVLYTISKLWWLIGWIIN